MTKTEKISNVINQYINNTANAGGDIDLAENTIDEIQRIIHSNSREYDDNQVYEIRVATEDSNYSDGYYTSLEKTVSHIIEKAVFVDNKCYYYYEGSPNHLPCYCIGMDEEKHKTENLEKIKKMLIESINGNCIGVECEKGVYYICTNHLVDK